MSFVINPYRFAVGGTAPVSFNPADPANIYIQFGLQNPADASQDRNAWTTNGTVTGARVDTARTLFGLPTAHFDTNNYIQMTAPAPDFSGLATSDFVMEAWVWAEGDTPDQVIFSAYENAGNRRQFAFQVGQAALFPSRFTTSGALVLQAPQSAIMVNTWQHHVWQRSGLQHTFFIDGVPVASQTATANDIWEAATPLIRFGRLGSNGGEFAGNLAQLRITFGEAFYPSTGFTPPQGPFPPVPPA